MKELPKYSLLQFNEFLKYRGVTRLPWKKEDSGPRPILPRLIHDNDSTPHEEAVSDSSSVLSRENDIENFLPGLEFSNAFDRGSEPRNPDSFYADKDTESGESIMSPEDDSFFKYVSSETQSDRRYSNNSERVADSSVREEIDTSKTQGTYREWEWHDSITRQEMLPDCHDSELSGSSSELSNNGGIYLPFRQRLSDIATDSFSLLQLPPAAKYRDSLKLNYMGSSTVSGLETSRRYKNNLAVVVLSPGGPDLLVCGCRSEVYVFEFDESRHIPKTNHVLRFDTRPQFTTDGHRIALTWAYYPHTINYMKSVPNWVQGPAIGVCTDDGSVLIWHVKTLRGEIVRQAQRKPPDPQLYTVRLEADVSLQLQSSAWGLDFASAYDSDGKQHFVLAASSNTQRATLFYFHELTGGYLSVSTHQLLHNIPDVSVVEYSIVGRQHNVIVSCASISGELVLFQFGFTINWEPSEPHESQWLFRREDVQFNEPIVIRRTSLGSECWTTKPVPIKFFKPVQSIRAMTGDPFIEEDKEVQQILTESKILSMPEDPKVSAGLGGAAYFQFFDSPVVYLATSENANHRVDDTSKFVTFEEEYQRIHQAYKHMCKHEISPSAGLQDKVLAVSTGLQLGLFRGDTLFCCGATKSIFTLEIPMTNETKWCNRILITHVINELLCFIGVSQQGLVTIMRLCEHRGLYGMRQEHLFPNALSLTIAESSIRTIIGLSVRDLSVSSEYPRFMLYIVYSDGLVLTYELREEGSAIVDMDF